MIATLVTILTISVLGSLALLVVVGAIAVTYLTVGVLRNL